MTDHITVLDFDHVYRYQSFLKQQKCNWVDLQSIAHTNLFCSKKTLQKIANILKKSPKNKITLIGSGNYHYITYIFLSFINKPFTLVLFDHHTDTLKSPSTEFITCGSWVLAALENIPQLKKVIIIGVNEEGKKFMPTSFSQKVRLYSKTLLQNNFTPTIRTLINEIATEDVYISIDKDVLDQNEAMTAWDHGKMTLEQLVTILKKIMIHKQIHMIDICGEYPISPSNEFSKNVIKANNINSYTNKLMIDSFQRWFKQFSPSTSLKHA